MDQRSGKQGSQFSTLPSVGNRNVEIFISATKTVGSIFNSCKTSFVVDKIKIIALHPSGIIGRITELMSMK